MDRQDVQRDARPMAFLADADLLQHDFLRAALPRHGGHAAAHPGLPGDVPDLERSLLARRVRLRAGAAALPVPPVHAPAQPRDRAAEAVGRRRLARLDAPADAGPVPHLRDAAGPQVMTKNVKTALILASIALTTFFGIIARYWLLK